MLDEDPVLQVPSPYIALSLAQESIMAPIQASPDEREGVRSYHSANLSLPYTLATLAPPRSPMFHCYFFVCLIQGSPPHLAPFEQ